MSTEARPTLVTASVEPLADSAPGGRARPLGALTATDAPAALPGLGAVLADAPIDGIALSEMALHEGPHRDEIVKRLRRAEGQLRGIMRMLDEGQGCMAVAQQLTAVRKALDAAMTRMAVNYLEQELGERGQSDPNILPAVEHVGRLISRLA